MEGRRKTQSLKYWEKDERPPELDLLCRLEERLLDPLVRGDRYALSALIHDDFLEFGSSGRSYEKSSMIDMMLQEEHRPLTTHAMKARLITDEVGLVTYRTAGEGGQVRRASVWVKQGDRWRIVFHQGSVLPEGWRPRG